MIILTLTNPVVIIGYIIALALNVFGIVKKCGFVVTAIYLTVFAATVAYALVSGATLYETATVAVVFFIINLLPKRKKGGDK